MKSRIVRQIVAISLLNVRSLRRRLGASMVLTFGIAGVVLVLISILSMAKGLDATLRGSGHPDRVMMMQTGSNSELNGSISPEQFHIVADAIGIAKNTDSKPIVAGEIYSSAFMPRANGERNANLPIRGVDAASFLVRPEVRIVTGRNLEFGKFEMIVGRKAAKLFRGLDVGSTLAVHGSSWTVVGQFSADDGIAESEAWTDATVMASAFRRGSSFTTLYARLSSPESLDDLNAAIASDPRLKVQALRETDYYSRQASASTGPIRLVGILIGALMALGAVFASLNTMYSAVAGRTKEIATLKALGFHATPIVGSILSEAMLLAFVGGLIGAAVAWLSFDGFTASTVGATYSQLSFRFAVTRDLVISGIGIALLLGLIGGLLPAIRAVRLPVVKGLAAMR